LTGNLNIRRVDNKILITGATGNIGKELIKALKSKNVNFAALTTKDEKIEGVETIKADFADIESLKNAMKGVSTLFLLLPSHPDAIKLGENAINVAKECGVNHVVRSSGSFANPNSELFLEKLLGTTDKYLKESGINYTITAPSCFMQNFCTTMLNDYKSGVIYQSAGEGKISWVDVRDIAAVNVEVLLNPKKFTNKELIITGQESLNYQETINQLNEITEKETKYVAITKEFATQTLIGMNFPQFFIDLIISLNESINLGHFTETNDTIEKVTGKKPITFKQFVTDYKNTWL
jgi:uncharacterized protein YbjT (DUF2867 family)